MSTVVIRASDVGWEGGDLSYHPGRAAATMAIPEVLLSCDGTYMRRHAQAVTVAPVTRAMQVQDRGGRSWRVSMAWDGMVGTVAEALGEFLRFVAGPGRTFSMALDRVSPGAPTGVRLFACLQAEPGWSGRSGRTWGASLEAVELPAGIIAESDVVTAGAAGWQGGGLQYGLPLQYALVPGLGRWEGAGDSSP